MYKYLEGIAHADVAFEVSCEKLDDLFSDAAKAMFGVMIEGDVEEKVKKEVKIENPELDRLLFDWLSELIYLKDTESLLFKRFDIEIKKIGKNHVLSAVVYGDAADAKKYKLKVDVKAVTMHCFSLRKTEKGWRAVVVVDI